MNRIGSTRGWQLYNRSLTRFSAHMDVGGLSHASLMKSIEILGTQIMPKVREAIKGSWTLERNFHNSEEYTF